MPKDYSNQDLQKVLFTKKDLSSSNFSGSDIRGADFTGSNLSGADFSRVRTGITPTNVALVFIGSVLVSALSGYLSMLAGQTIQHMIQSPDKKIKIAGILSGALIVLFIVFSYLKGVGKALSGMVLPVVVLGIILGLISYFTGFGTGLGMLYLVLSLVLVAVMFIVGTMARVTAGTLSSILFTAVALSGPFFAKNIGGGIGTTVLGISCMLISRRALSGAKGFEWVRRLAARFTARLGTSFRSTDLKQAKFSEARLHNVDFSNSDISVVNWNGTRRVNCLHNDVFITDKKQKKNG
jgi:hypothetical protein